MRELGLSNRPFDFRNTELIPPQPPQSNGFFGFDVAR